MGGRKGRVGSGCARGDLEDKNHKMIINEIMLRFRPIAPRPVTADRTAGLLPLKRTKRKYVRVKKKNKMVDECNLTVTEGNGWMSCLSDQTETVTKFVTDPVRKADPQWISFDVTKKNHDDDDFFRWIAPARPPTVDLHEVDLTAAVRPGKLIESWITVESVTGTCDEILKDLEMDSCPGFISNGNDEVQWVNLAYRRMVDRSSPDGGAPAGEVVVWLGVKVEKSAFEYWPAFSCRVRVVYMLSEKKKKQMTVPCDVWKMDSGGYAWRLDVKAALSLGMMN
ncbi:hypothetical protein SSX86_028987 [Deinandra increscens subsp. villosa]|uniref:DUF7950 domain-containing protein n=1 Tax=Deinandra increscens subsp. villosa TaxID=3103831 RepID=A0AAP0CFA1_9ASTR